MGPKPIGQKLADLRRLARPYRHSSRGCYHVARRSEPGACGKTTVCGKTFQRRSLNMWRMLLLQLATSKSLERS